MSGTRKVTFDLGDCNRCQGCIEVAGDYVGWEESLDMPVLREEMLPEDLAQELIALCPNDCFSYDDE